MPSDSSESEFAMTPTDPSRTEQVDAIDSDSIDNDRPPSSGLRRGLLTAAVVALALAAAGATGAALARGGSDGEAALAAASSTPTPSDDERRADKDGRRGGPADGSATTCWAARAARCTAASSCRTATAATGRC